MEQYYKKVVMARETTQITLGVHIAVVLEVTRPNNGAIECRHLASGHFDQPTVTYFTRVKTINKQFSWEDCADQLKS